MLWASYFYIDIHFFFHKITILFMFYLWSSQFSNCNYVFELDFGSEIGLSVKTISAGMLL